MQPKTLEEVRQQFPRANYAPRENCKHCAGSGEKTGHPNMPCLYIFVDHTMCDWAATSLAQTARKILDELR